MLLGIVWTIFFHRIFGPMTPTTNDFFSITYPMAADQPFLDSLIDEKIDLLIKSRLDKGNANTKHREDQEKGTTYGQIVIQFLGKMVRKSKKKSGWFGQIKSSEADDLQPWEIWTINVKCLPLPKVGSIITTAGTGKESQLTEDHVDEAHTNNVQVSTRSFEECVFKTINIADSHKDHIPPITSLDNMPFPYTIDIEHTTPPAEEQDESWGKYIKKILD